MSVETLAVIAALHRRGAVYVELSKPRLVSMILLATAVGFYLGASGSTGWLLLLHVLASTALAAAGTLALNQYLERDLDSLMIRTQGRPLPAGKLEPGEALFFGILMTGVGLFYQASVVSLLAASVTAGTTLAYLCVYTPMKRRSPFCTLAGAVAGALPPVAGWAAARGSLDLGAWALFAILFLWQIPHSLAIARLYRDDYARAGIRLLPVIDPEGAATGRQIVLNSAALLSVALLPTLLGMTGPLYFYSALFLGLTLLAFSVRLARSPALSEARQLLFATLLYLPLLLAVMAVDKVG